MNIDNFVNDGAPGCAEHWDTDQAGFKEESSFDGPTLRRSSSTPVEYTPKFDHPSEDPQLIFRVDKKLRGATMDDFIVKRMQTPRPPLLAASKLDAFHLHHAHGGEEPKEYIRRVGSCGRRLDRHLRRCSFTSIETGSTTDITGNKNAVFPSASSNNGRSQKMRAAKKMGLTGYVDRLSVKDTPTLSAAVHLNQKRASTGDLTSLVAGRPRRKQVDLFRVVEGEARGEDVPAKPLPTPSRQKRVSTGSIADRLAISEHVPAPPVPLSQKRASTGDLTSLGRSRRKQGKSSSMSVGDALACKDTRTKRRPSMGSLSFADTSVQTAPPPSSFLQKRPSNGDLASLPGRSRRKNVATPTKSVLPAPSRHKSGSTGSIVDRLAISEHAPAPPVPSYQKRVSTGDLTSLGRSRRKQGKSSSMSVGDALASKSTRTTRRPSMGSLSFADTSVQTAPPPSSFLQKRPSKGDLASLAGRSRRKNVDTPTKSVLPARSRQKRASTGSIEDRLAVTDPLVTAPPVPSYQKRASTGDLMSLAAASQTRSKQPDTSRLSVLASGKTRSVDVVPPCPQTGRRQRKQLSTRSVNLQHIIGAGRQTRSGLLPKRMDSADETGSVPSLGALRRQRGTRSSRTDLKKTARGSSERNPMSPQGKMTRRISLGMLYNQSHQEGQLEVRSTMSISDRLGSCRTKNTRRRRNDRDGGESLSGDKKNASWEVKASRKHAKCYSPAPSSSLRRLGNISGSSPVPSMPLKRSGTSPC